MTTIQEQMAAEKSAPPVDDETMRRRPRPWTTMVRTKPPWPRRPRGDASAVLESALADAAAAGQPRRA